MIISDVRGDEITRFLRETFDDALERCGGTSGLIEPIHRHKIQKFREIAINYEIMLEMKYLKVKVIKSKFKG